MGIVAHSPFCERDNVFELTHLGRTTDYFHILNSVGAVCDCIHHFFGMRDGGVGDMLVPDLHHVGQTLTLCLCVDLALHR